MTRPFFIVACLPALAMSFSSAQDERLHIENTVIVTGDAEWDMTQARTAFVPGDEPLAITTMSKTARVGAHGFHDVFVSVSRDSGKTWMKPRVVPELKRARQADGYEVVAGDLWPRWHAATGRVLVTGKTFNFENGEKENILREKIAYAVLDPETLDGGPMKTVVLPEKDREGKPFVAPNAGCNQWVELPDGDVILPIRYQKSAENRNYTSTVIRCRFDGELLGSYNTQQHFAEIGGRLYLIYTRRGAGNDHIMRHRAPLFIGEIDTDLPQVKRDTEQVLVPENGATLGNSGVCQIAPDEAWITVAEGRVALSETRAGESNRVILARVRKAGP